MQALLFIFLDFQENFVNMYIELLQKNIGRKEKMFNQFNINFNHCKVFMQPTKYIVK